MLTTAVAVVEWTSKIPKAIWDAVRTVLEKVFSYARIIYWRIKLHSDRERRDRFEDKILLWVQISNKMRVSLKKPNESFEQLFMKGYLYKSENFGEYGYTYFPHRHVAAALMSERPYLIKRLRIGNISDFLIEMSQWESENKFRSGF